MASKKGTKLQAKTPTGIITRTTNHDYKFVVIGRETVEHINGQIAICHKYNAQMEARLAEVGGYDAKGYCWWENGFSGFSAACIEDNNRAIARWQEELQKRNFGGLYWTTRYDLAQKQVNYFRRIKSLVDIQIVPVELAEAGKVQFEGGN
jgi:hypothetical protein